VKLPRRKFLHLVAGAAALPAMSGVASALDYPTRPVHILVGFAPAGATDICARLIGQRLSERLGQQFIVENRPGAGSNIATEVVVRAPADAYTLLVFGPPAAFNATLYDNLNFNFLRDIVPIGGQAAYQRRGTADCSKYRKTDRAIGPPSDLGSAKRRGELPNVKKYLISRKDDFQQNQNNDQ
jgi:Tripartite tricarboxylate transporter family receptor